MWLNVSLEALKNWTWPNQDRIYVCVCFGLFLDIFACICLLQLMWVQKYKPSHAFYLCTLLHEMLHHTFKMLSFSNQSCTSSYPSRLMGLKVDFADNCFNFTTLSYGPQETQPFIWWYWAEEPLCRSKAVKAFRKIRYMRKRVRMECVGL